MMEWLLQLCHAYWRVPLRLFPGQVTFSMANHGCFLNLLVYHKVGVNLTSNKKLPTTLLLVTIGLPSMILLDIANNSSAYMVVIQVYRAVVSTIASDNS